MKRLIAIVLVVSAIYAVGSAANAQATTIHHHSTTNLDHVGEVQAQDSTSAWCKVEVTGFGLSLIATAYSSGLLAWLGWAGIGLAFPGIAKECGLDAYWHHVGYRKLCWEPYFVGWTIPDSPQGEQPVFAPAPPCQVSPTTADGVFCQYLHGDDNACLNQYLADLAFAVWSGISLSLFL